MPERARIWERPRKLSHAAAQHARNPCNYAIFNKSNGESTCEIRSFNLSGLYKNVSILNRKNTQNSVASRNHSIQNVFSDFSSDKLNGKSGEEMGFSRMDKKREEKATGIIAFVWCMAKM
jgi:hypothetical protein